MKKYLILFYICLCSGIVFSDEIKNDCLDINKDLKFQIECLNDVSKKRLNQAGEYEKKMIEVKKQVSTWYKEAETMCSETRKNYNQNKDTNTKNRYLFCIKTVVERCDILINIINASKEINKELSDFDSRTQTLKSQAEILKNQLNNLNLKK